MVPSHGSHQLSPDSQSTPSQAQAAAQHQNPVHGLHAACQPWRTGLYSRPSLLSPAAQTAYGQQYGDQSTAAQTAYSQQYGVQKTGHYSPRSGDPDNTGVYYGEEKEVEVEPVDWESLFKQHQEETKRIAEERDAKIEEAQKQKKSWELLRECLAFLKGNEKKWKVEEEDRTTERQRKEKKNLLKQKQAQKQIQQKITNTWKLIPEHEQRNLIKEEGKKKTSRPKRNQSKRMEEMEKGN